MWNNVIKFFEDIAGKVNLDYVFWAGIGVMGLVAILTLVGCFVKKRLVPMGIVWAYLLGAAFCILPNNAVTNLNVMLYMTFPILTVLACYLIVISFKSLTHSKCQCVKTEKAPKEVVAKNPMPIIMKEEKEVQEEIKEVKEEKSSFFAEEPKKEEVQKTVVSQSVETVKPAEPAFGYQIGSKASAPAPTKMTPYTETVSRPAPVPAPAPKAVPVSEPVFSRPATPSPSTSGNRSAQDVLDAIARLRASMGKKS